MTRRSLARLSDAKLLSELRSLVNKEKQTTLAVLLHLAEVDRRELYLEYGFSSLYDYCVGALGYSRSAAGRRIASARCIRRWPEVYRLLESREVGLSTIGLVAPILTDANKDALLDTIRNKTRRQVETIVAGHTPPITFRDRVKPVRVAVTDMGQNAKNRRNSLIFNSRRGSNPANGGDRGRPGSESGRGDWARVRRAPTQQIDADKPAPTSTDPPPPMPDGSPAPRIEKRLLVQFLATEGFMAKLDEVKALLSNRLPTGTFEEVFEVLISEFLERHSPEKRHRRRERRMAKPATKSPGDTSKPTRGSSSPRPAAPRTRSRHIPAAVRDTVFARDHGRCTYRGKRGNRCGATRCLHVDHIKPFARGGSNALSNLRLLCAKHNRLEAKRVMGPDVINRFTKRD